MLRNNAILLFATIALAAAAAHAQPAATSPAEYLSQEQLVKAYRDAQHNAVIRETARILANPKIAASYDRFNLLLLRAESLLQIKNVDAAIPAFTAAAKEAPTDFKKAAMLATVELLQRRTGMQYIPKSTQDPPVSIVALDQRRTAHETLFRNEAAVLTQQIDRLETRGDSSAGFQQLGAAVTQLDLVATLGTAAGDDGKQTKKQREALVIAAESVLARHLKDFTAKLQDLAESHAKRNEQNNGFDAGEVTAIQRGMDSLDLVPKAAEQLAQRLAADPALFQPVIDQAPKVKEQARILLNRFPQNLSQNNTSILKGAR